MCASTATLTSQTLQIAKSSKDRQDISSIKENAFATDKTFRDNLHSTIPSNFSALKLYLEDEGTISVLISHAREKVIEAYSLFRTSVSTACGLEVLTSLLTIEELKKALHSTINPSVAT